MSESLIIDNYLTGIRISSPEGFDTNVLTNESGVVLVNVCALNGRLPTRF